MTEKTFPIMRQPNYHSPHPTTIPWSIAEMAYSVYRNRYSSEQSLQNLADRGGFGPGEMDTLLPNWCALVAQYVPPKFLVDDDLVTAVHSAVIGFHHTITAENVILKYDPTKPGNNALHQMHERIRVALKKALE